MITLFKKKLNPAWYQGNKNNSRHFEGWYFKIVDKDEHNVYAIIPGVFIDKEKTDSHSFIQIFNGSNNESYYFRFPIEYYEAGMDRYFFWLAASRKSEAR